MKKFAVILSGCGVFDGSEIHEATLSLLALAKHGCQYEIFAPDIKQHHVINHLTGKEMKEARNVLVESARIARGKISDLKKFNADAFDGLILPGGFGAAKNLSTWAFDGPEASVLPQVEDAIRDMVSRNKPVGALCIAPVLLARIFGQVKVTIGNDPGTIRALDSLGASHVKAAHTEVVVDTKYNLVTTPAYMLDATIDQIAEGAEKVVKAMTDLMDHIST
ncbi:MAG TPA: isoprenoid biosynthesis glyoxalase ElbB [Bacteroides sp.]|nr:isoprenoid biosynthesis glyoxalase ElbB [Bacteroides sp.]